MSTRSLDHKEQKMKDAIFMVSSALNAKTSRSLYSFQERFDQTLKTIESIQTYCPNSEIYIFDSSVEKPADEVFSKLVEKGAAVLYTGTNPDIQAFTSYHMQSVVETISLASALMFVKSNSAKAKRVYKISGRYRLNENFVPGLEHVGKYVFTVPTKTWMSEDRIRQTGIDHVYQTRLFHFDYDLMDEFMLNMPEVIRDCIELAVDMEHAYYKNFKKYEPIEVKTIGVCGNLSPTGEYIDE